MRVDRLLSAFSSPLLTRFSYFWQPIVLLCLTVSLLFVSQWLMRRAAVVPETVRLERIRQNDWQRRLVLFEHHAQGLQQEKIRPLSVDDFRLTILEWVGDISANPGWYLVSYRIDRPTVVVPAMPEQAPTTVIRLQLQLRMPHAPGLLALLEELRSLAGWRPVEVRACSIQRDALHLQLAVDCSIDVYHWPLGV